MNIKDEINVIDRQTKKIKAIKEALIKELHGMEDDNAKDSTGRKQLHSEHTERS